MIDPTEVTRAQKHFLRAFRQNPAGPAPADWPSPGVLRRWLKNRRFKKALTAVREAIRFQTDFHLAAAAAAAPKRNPRDHLTDENRSILGPSKPMHYYEQCLNNAQLLKDLLLYGVKRGGGHIYDQFLASFPEELARAHAHYDRHHKPTAPPTPAPTTPA